ncbi:MAG: HAMP domain-containing histidine kinase [Chloroflexi bacterium]|nr:HAMP domain-containing histidine kinase [Chloroflexota bacterium]
MRIRWWQSIRWRLMLGSVFLSLLVIVLLALTTIIVIIYYYEVDQRNRVESLAIYNAHNLGTDFLQTNNLYLSVRDEIPGASTQSPQSQYLVIVLNRGGALIYPRFSAIDPRSSVINYMLKFADPSIQKNDFNKLATAIMRAKQGISSSNDFSNGSPLGISHPYEVRPIFYGAQSDGPVIGVVVVTPRSDVIPSFVTTVGSTVLVASLGIALLVALLAIFFSSTITRPLAKLTKAAHVLGSGDYSAQVTTEAPGELGELAHTFNEMATQLNRDVEELRQQEIWRRELIMSITHDLATPLTAIAGLGESLVDGVNQSREDYEATGRIIVRETLRLRRLVKDLHVMAKVEAGALHPQRKGVRLAALVDEVLAVLAPEFERVRVEPRNAIAYNLPTVQADPDMLTRVFSNLCDNALRHTPADGTVTIDATDQGDVLAISVTDTGEGIPPEAVSRVFERFFRADSARQSRTGGSGLGLAIVRAIVEAHGGTVWAENVPEAGARITFTLPLRINGEMPLPDETTLPAFRTFKKKE